MDTLDPRHEQLVEHAFRRACALFEMPGFELRPLRRRARGRGKLYSLRLGYTKIGERKMTVDLYTPRTMQPRKMDAILRVIAHEFAHHQAPPCIARRGFRLVRYAHHPAFWKQCKENVAMMERDELLGAYFRP
jgi:hypothetical protein